MNRVVGGVVGAVLVICVASCTVQEAVPAASPSSPSPGADPDLVSGPRAAAGVIDQMASSKVRVAVRSLNGGSVESVPGRGGGQAVRLPRFDRGTKAPSAVIEVSPVGDEDDLSPGTSGFSYGADFRLDATSSGSSSDNGDNLLQRGLFSGEAQYKVQIDKHVPSCSVQGTKGTLLVKADDAVEDTGWHRVTCTRQGDLLTIETGRYDEDGSLVTSSKSADGDVGEVSFPADVPLSIGGKLTPDGTVAASSTDQFNGEIDSAFYELDQ